jgi:hypothetical protein
MCSFQERSLLSVTHRYFIKEHIEELENVQRRGARFVFNNYKSREPGCVTNMLNTLQWEPLAHRRAKARVTMCFGMETLKMYSEN